MLSRWRYAPALWPSDVPVFRTRMGKFVTGIHRDCYAAHSVPACPVWRAHAEQSVDAPRKVRTEPEAEGSGAEISLRVLGVPCSLRSHGRRTILLYSCSTTFVVPSSLLETSCLALKPDWDHSLE